MEVPLSGVRAWRSSFQVAWQPFFPAGSHLVSAKLTPYCTRSSHQQFELHYVVRIFQIDRHGQSLFLPLESFVDIVCESGCVFPVVFPALYPPWFGGSTFLLYKSSASFLATIRSIMLSCGVLHCEDSVSVQLAMVLSWFWDWLEVTM